MRLQRVVPNFPAGLLCSLALLAASVPLYCIVTYGVDVPFWDQWRLVPLLEKAYSHTLTISHLWEQHNVHRMLFPRLIMIGLARLTAWNVKWEMATSFALSIIIFLLLCHLGREAVGELWHGRMKWILIPALASIVFSLSQWANYTWGWQIQIFLSVGAVVGGFVLLSRRSIGFVAFLMALVLGIVASYSFGTGLVYWPIGFWLLGGKSDRPQRSTVIRRLVWVMVAVLTIYVYAHDFEQPGRRPLRIVTWAQWLDYLRYTLAYFGSPIALFAPAVAPLAGLLGIAGFGSFFLALSRSKLQMERTLRSTAGIGLYSVGCGLLTGIGRVSLGGDQALSSRYVTFGMLFWIAILLMSIRVLMSGTDAKILWYKDRMATRRLAIAITILIVGLVQVSSAYEVPRMMRRYQKLKHARAELYRMKNDRPLRCLLQNTETLKRRFIPILRKWHLSVWRETEDNRLHSLPRRVTKQPKTKIAFIELRRELAIGPKIWRQSNG